MDSIDNQDFEHDEQFMELSPEEMQKMLDKEEAQRFAFGQSLAISDRSLSPTNNTISNTRRRLADLSMGTYFKNRSSYPFSSWNEKLTLMESRTGDETRYPQDLPEKDEHTPGVEIRRQLLDDTMEVLEMPPDEKDAAHATSDVSNLFNHEKSHNTRNISSQSIQSSRKGRYSLGSWGSSTSEGEGIAEVLQPVNNNVTQTMEENNGSISSLVQFFQDPEKMPMTSTDIMDHVIQYCKSRTSTINSHSKYKQYVTNSSSLAAGGGVGLNSQRLSSLSTLKENKSPCLRDNFLDDSDQSQQYDISQFDDNGGNELERYNASNILKKHSSLVPKNQVETIESSSYHHGGKHISNSNESHDYRMFSQELQLEQQRKPSRCSTPDSGIARTDDRKSSIYSVCPTVTSNNTAAARHTDSGCGSSKLYKSKGSSTTTRSTGNRHHEYASTNSNSTATLTSASALQKQQQRLIDKQGNGSDVNNFVEMHSSVSMISKTINRRQGNLMLTKRNSPPVLKEKYTTSETNAIQLLQNHLNSEEQLKASLSQPSASGQQSQQIVSASPSSSSLQTVQQQQPIQVQFNFPAPAPSNGSSSVVNVPPIVINLACPSMPATTDQSDGSTQQRHPRMSLNFSASIQLN